MATAKQLTMQPATREELAEELGKNLASGGCFVAGATGLEPNDACELVIVHPCGARLALAARVVWVAASGPKPGIGVAFEGFSPAMRAELVAFCELESAEPDAAEEGDPEPSDDDPDAPKGLHARMRALPLHEQLRVARDGDASERVVLERLYGKAVWPALLANPRLTIAEVIRIARMGNLPLPQLEVIAGNAAWLSNGQVRRALLGNPRLSIDMARRVLQAMPRPELKLVPTQTAYSPAIRAEAKRMIARG